MNRNLTALLSQIQYPIRNTVLRHSLNWFANEEIDHDFAACGFLSKWAISDASLDVLQAALFLSHFTENMRCSWVEAYFNKSDAEYVSEISKTIRRSEYTETFRYFLECFDRKPVASLVCCLASGFAEISLDTIDPFELFMCWRPLFQVFKFRSEDIRRAFGGGVVPRIQSDINELRTTVLEDVFSDK